MNQSHTTPTERYAKVIEVSKRVRWEIERDVIRGRVSTTARPSCPTACRWSTSWAS